MVTWLLRVVHAFSYTHRELESIIVEEDSVCKCTYSVCDCGAVDDGKLPGSTPSSEPCYSLCGVVLSCVSRYDQVFIFTSFCFSPTFLLSYFAPSALREPSKEQIITICLRHETRTALSTAAAAASGK